MRLLVLGGTAWLGREIAVAAASRGHEVTCLARGDSGAAPPEARLLRADRDGSEAYDAVAGLGWDAVVDVATQPGHVRRAVAALEPVARRYLLVSTSSVYADHRELGQDEDAPLLSPLESDVLESMEKYGEAKVACEQAVLSTFGVGRSLVARAGLIGGPGDESGRSGYWPWRFAQPSSAQGAVLVPDAPDVPTALIDVRDLAGWLLDCAAGEASGVFNVGGVPVPLAEHLALARAVAGHTGPLVSAPAPWLSEHGVVTWMGPRSLPLWISRDGRGMNARDTTRARQAGLVTRPLEQTLTDTLAWELARPAPGPHGAGLTDGEERELLDALVKTAR